MSAMSEIDIIRKDNGLSLPQWNAIQEIADRGFSVAKANTLASLEKRGFIVKVSETNHKLTDQGTALFGVVSYKTDSDPELVSVPLGETLKWNNTDVWHGLTAEEIREDMDTALPIGRKARRERARIMRKALATV